MKILHVITTLFIGGAEKLLVDILPRLKKAGHEVDLLVFNGTYTKFREELEEAEIMILDCGEETSVYNLKNLFKLRSIIGNYDIVHTHNTSPQFFAAIASIGKNTKLITTEHSTNNRRRNWRVFALLDRWMYSKYNAIICISEKTKKHLLHFIGTIPSSIITINNGVDVTFFNNASPLTEITEEFKGKILIAQVAAFRFEKDQPTTIKSLKYLPKQFHLLLIGDGPLRKECELISKNLGLENRVHFLRNRWDIHKILKTVDFVVMSSKWEGFGLSAVEGMAAGKPVLASDVDGLREVVKGAGILFKPSDSKSLANEILKLYHSPELYKNTVFKCEQRAKQFDISKMTERYLKVYNDLFC